MSELRDLPSIDKLLNTTGGQRLVNGYGRVLTTDALRSVLEQARSNHQEIKHLPDTEEIIIHTGEILNLWVSPTLREVINATGVIIHTNLGRAPLSASSIQAMTKVSEGYSNLEFDLDKGKRGSRLIHTEGLLTRLTGAEAALVVNNNAAAVLLCLTALARRRRVLISRTQLVEIGGGFRIPDVMLQSGAKLVEIGTTNRVHLRDYQQAIEQQPIKLVMRVHRSNFSIIGFHTEPELSEIAKIAYDAGIPLIEDLGSGTLLDTSPFGLDHEPTVQETLAGGADLVTFSGDKLLGGPQAGIIVGRKTLIKRLKSHPLARAIRADKLVLSGLSATLTHYLKGEAFEEIPVWQMISSQQEALKERALSWVEKIGYGEVIEGESTVGGGSLPGQILPTALLRLPFKSPDKWLKEFREQNPPLIARILADSVVLDPRTVRPYQDTLLVNMLDQLLTDFNKDI